MQKERVLIACIGNIFFGDDAFGCEVAKRLAARELRPEVTLFDFGIRSYDLGYALMDGYETTVFVDTMPRGGAPGSIYVIEPDFQELDAMEIRPMSFEPHGMDPMKVLAMVRSQGGTIGKLFIVGCEPEFTGGSEGHMGLSSSVAASVGRAVELVESIISRSLDKAVLAANLSGI